MRGADADRNGVDLKPRISVFTLGVADLQQSLTFYREGLGLPTQGIVVREFEHGTLGSRLIDRQSQKMTVAARATAERKVFAHRS